MNLLPMQVGKFSRLRLRGHLGSDLEIEYELLRFGIQMDGLFQKDRNDDISGFIEFVTRRKEMERRRSQIDTSEAIERGYVEYPSPSDSIIGRGRPYRDWVGNVVWNSIVDKYVDSYRFADSKFVLLFFTFAVASCISWKIVFAHNLSRKCILFFGEFKVCNFDYMQMKERKIILETMQIYE